MPDPRIARTRERGAHRPRSALAVALLGAVLAGCASGSIPLLGGARSQEALLTAVAAEVDGTTGDPSLRRALARLRLASGDAQSWVELGDALMQRGRESEDSLWFERGEQAYRRALELDETSPAARVGLAWVLNVRHAFEASRDQAERALAADPDNASAHGLLGDALLELGDEDGAAPHYQAMLDLRPDLASYSRAGQLLYRRGDLVAAIRLMQLAIEAGSGHAEHVAWCRAQLALMLWRSGRLVDAERVLAPALERAPEHVDVLLVAARLQASRGDYTAAIELYERGVGIAPHYAPLVELADLYEWTGREALSQATRVRIEAMHQRPGADGEPGPLQIARYYADHDRRPEEAVRLAKAAHAGRATRASAETLAWAYFKAGRLEEAEHALREALAPGRREADLLFHAGLIYAGLGQRRTAQQYLYEALSLNPHFDVRGARLAAESLRTLAARR